MALSEEHADDEVRHTRPSWVQWTLVGVAALFGIALALVVVILVASKWSRSRDDVAVPAVANEAGNHDDQTAADTAPTVIPTDAPKTPEAPQPTEPSPQVASDSTPTENPPADEVAVTPALPPDNTPTESQAPATTDVRPDAPPMADAAPDADVTVPVNPPEVPANPAPDAPPADVPPAVEPNTAVTDPNSPLALAVAGAEFDGVALVDFLQFFATYTTIPVTVDFDAVRQAGLADDALVNLQLEATSAGQLLQNALEPVGLAYTFANGQILVGPAKDVRKEIESRSYDVSDLAETPEQVTALVMLIHATIEPATWQEAGGLGVLTQEEQSLDVEQSVAVHFEIARLLDRLRTGRGLLPRSDIARELLTTEPVFAALEPMLRDKRLTLNFSDPTELMTVLERLRNETEVRLLVDWESTRDADWRPTTPTTLSATDAPVGQLLDTWLTPMQLGYRVVDGQVIQIASLAFLTTRGEVEVYRLTTDAAKKVDAIVPGLKQELGESAVSAAGGAFAFEPASRCLVMRLPQPLQRQAHRWLSSHGHLEPTK